MTEAVTHGSPAGEPPAQRGQRLNLFFESRYRKLVRGLPQTVFFCPACKGNRRRREGCATCNGFGKLTRESVQELIARRMVPAFRARSAGFHGAGREDIDVLMLGKGRPFVIELQGVRNPEVDLEALRAEVVERAGGAIEIAPFERVRRDRVAHWKQSHFEKVYRAEVACESAVSEAGLAVARAFDGTIVQRTPQRVAHRRADLARERRVRVLAARLLGPQRVEVELLCQHGTYVKEWISGDEERTTPSLASLLGAPSRCDVLDVLEILTPDVEGPRLGAVAVPGA